MPIPSNGKLTKSQPVKPHNILCTNHVQDKQLMWEKGLQVTPQPSLLLIQRLNDTRHKTGQQNLMPHLSHVLLLRADSCRFRHGFYLCSFMYLLNKWLLNTCYCPLLYEELEREHCTWSCLPVSYALVRGVGKKIGSQRLVTGAEVQVSWSVFRVHVWVISLVTEWEFQEEMGL